MKNEELQGVEFETSNFKLLANESKIARKSYDLHQDQNDNLYPINPYYFVVDSFGEITKKTNFLV